MQQKLDRLTGVGLCAIPRAVELFRDHQQLPSGLDPCAVAVGSFDGLHLGHRLLLTRTLERAASAGSSSSEELRSAVLTFEPHPARALAPGLSPPLLMSYERKIRALDHLGFDRVLAQRFTGAFAALSPKEFAQQVLADALAARVVVVGDDFTFGQGGQGRTEDLVALGRSLGFEVEVVRRLAVEGMIASSTRIRSFLLQGRVRAAGLLLGRPYTIAGRVVTGRGRGRKLGYPTANLNSDAELLPARGVYACHAWRAGWGPGGRLAVTNIGTNPTFGGGLQTIEIHVLDMSEDISDQHLALSFREHLRTEMVFSSADELVAQIGMDVARARELARAYPAEPKLDPASGIDLARS